MSSSFTVPKSQKRKRPEGQGATAKKPRVTGGAPREARKSRADEDDESISGSDTDLSIDEGYESAQSGLSRERETAAEKRLRLAEEYLQTLRDDTTQELGFDAEEIDRDLIAERLKEDVAETKGKLYRFVASSYSWSNPSRAFFSVKDTAITTAVATHGDFAYTATKDLRITKWRIPRDLNVAARNGDKGQAERKDVVMPHPELSKAQRRKLRDKKSRDRQRAADTGAPGWERGPTKVTSSKGSRRYASDKSYQHHVGPILCLACSPDGRLLVSGGSDKRLIVWDAEKLTPKRIFTQHRDSITGLAFRRGSNQLFSASADRTIKVWSLDEMAYVETLFGHQDKVHDVGALQMERCVSVGGRDRTARVWKVVEETQLVFRGGGSAVEKGEKRHKGRGPVADAELKRRKDQAAYGEGSIDRVALIDDEMFVTGSDNGSISLWSVQKKKPLHTIPLAHGLDSPLSREEAFADLEIDDGTEVPGPPLPRWITALAAIPYSDLIVSGSWDGVLRVWRVSEDKRRLEAVASLGQSGADAGIPQLNGSSLSHDEGINGEPNGTEVETTKTEVVVNGSNATNSPTKVVPFKGIINDLAVSEQGERGKETLYIVVGTGKEHRLGRWLTKPGKNGAHVLALRKR